MIYKYIILKYIDNIFDWEVSVGGSSTERDGKKSPDPAVSETPGQSEVSSLAPAWAPAVLHVPVLSSLIILIITSEVVR